jgi:hypothetical protein
MNFINFKLNTTSPIHSDLVNNFKLFHEYHTPKQLEGLPDWKDDSNYSNHMHIDSFLDDLNESMENDENVKDILERQHILVVPISYIFSSEGKNGGYDRPIFANTRGKEQSLKNLNLKKEDNSLKGYVSTDAMVLSAFLRYDEKENRWQLVKDKGNNRLVMKLLANRGEDTDVLVHVKFHNIDNSMKECIRVEAESHSTDAGERSGQNERQKFCSAYKAGRKDAVECHEFLRYMNIFYGDMDAGEGELEITSLQGLKHGMSNGYFQKYGKTESGELGKENVEWALKTIKAVAKITGEKSFGSSPLESFTQMYHCFCSYGKTAKSEMPIFYKKELYDFFIEFFKERNKVVSSSVFGNKPNAFKLQELSQTGAMKSITYISARTFWPLITDYWQTTIAIQPNRVRHNGKQSFGVNSFAVQKFLDHCKDPLVKSHIKKAVEGEK